MYKNLWLKFGCFLCGYNYLLINSCSEASKKSVKKYTAALLIIMILWALIGFLFTREYIRLNYLGSTIASIMMMIIIVQVERQIILGSKSKKAAAFRVLIGITMAILGSVIIDQILFKEDVEKHKMFTVEKEVGIILPERTNEINAQIIQLDSLIQNKENERSLLIEEITAKPTIKLPESSSKRIPSKITMTTMVDGELVPVQKDTTIIERTYATKAIPNPKVDFIPTINDQIESLRENRNDLSKQLINVRSSLRNELLKKKGFLDEIEVMFDIITSSKVSLGMWLLWFFFFLAIELFVLMSKYGDKENDYDKTIEHQKNMRIKAINALINKN